MIEMHTLATTLLQRLNKLPRMENNNSDKSIYEKTLQMLMKAGQAAFDQNNIDDDEQMQEERVDVIATEVDRDNSRNERHTRTLEYYFRPKEAHK